MPITWKNVGMTPSGAAASLAGASDSFRSAGTLLKEAFQGPLETQLKMTEENRLRDTAARQQEAHTLAQQLGKYQVDEAAFNAGTQAEMFELDKRLAEANIAARGRQYTGTNSKGSVETNKAQQRRMADQIVRAYTDPTTGKVDRLKAMSAAANANVGNYFMDNSIKQMYEATGNKQADANKKANAGKYKGLTYKEAPNDLQADTWSMDNDADVRRKWSKLYGKLRQAGANDAEARESLDQGIDSGIFYDTWDNHPLIKNDIKEFAAKKDLRNKKK